MPSDKIDKIPRPKIPDDASIIPVFTDVFDYEDLNLTEGWRLFNRATCRLDSENDSVEIKSMLNESIIDVINYHKTNGISLVDMISVRVREQGRIIPYGDEYDVDFDNFNKKITDSAEIIEDDKGTGFWTDYEIYGTIDDTEEKLKTWNNHLKHLYDKSVGYKASENDPDKKIWNSLVDFVKLYE